MNSNIFDTTRSSSVLLSPENGTWVSQDMNVIESFPGPSKLELTHSTCGGAYGLADTRGPSEPLAKECFSYLKEAYPDVKFDSVHVQVYEGREASGTTSFPTKTDNFVAVFFFGSSVRRFSLEAVDPLGTLVPAISFQTHDNSMLVIAGSVPCQQYQYTVGGHINGKCRLVMLTFVGNVN